MFIIFVNLRIFKQLQNDYLINDREILYTKF